MREFIDNSHGDILFLDTDLDIQERTFRRLGIVELRVIEILSGDCLGYLKALSEPSTSCLCVSSLSTVNLQNDEPLVTGKTTFTDAFDDNKAFKPDGKNIIGLGSYLLSECVSIAIKNRYEVIMILALVGSEGFYKKVLGRMESEWKIKGFSVDKGDVVVNI